MKRSSIILMLFLWVVGAGACKHQPPATEVSESESRTPVTLTSATIGELTDVTELNATSSFLMKTYVKATVNGYLLDVNIKPGDRVAKGLKLFTIRTREAEYLENTVNEVDSSFMFKGLNQIVSPVNGYITQLSFLPGNYVQEGEILAAINDLTSLVFLMDLPYELKSCLQYNNELQLMLPDGKEVKGKISSSLPVVDPVSQSQTFIIRLSSNELIPENLTARVKFIRRVKSHAISLPREAVLTNEEQSEFWIMMMTDSNTAVKVPVKKGIETSGLVEILSPVLKQSDKIVLTGNYGLGDTAKVTIENGLK